MAADHVNKSATKAKLMDALHLIHGNSSHERLYLAMKLECAVGYDAICADRSKVKPEFSHIKERLTYNQIDPTAIDQAIVDIYRNASPAVRGWYNHWQVYGTKDNFIIAWFLYHSFRNRDARNDRKARSSDFHADDDDDNGSLGSGNSPQAAVVKQTSFYDTARNGYRTK